MMGPSLRISLIVACMLGLTSVSSAALVVPQLDDRSYEQLVEEVAERIPAHNPEWTDHNNSDPGVALLDLFDGLGAAGVNALIDDFQDVPPWTSLERDDETYWSELGYVTMEAGLSLIASNHQIGSSWPETYWPQTHVQVLEQEYEDFKHYANIPEPTTLSSLLAASLTMMGMTRRNRRSCPES